MFIHPLVAVFMAFQFGMTGSAIRTTPSIFGWAFVAFGIGLVLAGFVPEVIKAKRLISAAVLGTTSTERERTVTT